MSNTRFCKSCSFFTKQNKKEYVDDFIICRHIEYIEKYQFTRGKYSNKYVKIQLFMMWIFIRFSIEI